eukprot:403332416
MDNKTQFENKNSEQHCQHPYIIGDSFIKNCKTCGLFLPKTGVMSYRNNSRSYECDFFISDLLREIYSKALKRQQINLSSLYMQSRSVLIDWLTQIGDIFHLQMSTMHLSVTILDLYFQDDKTNQIGSKAISSKQQLNFELYAISSLMIAAKSLEKDEKIPKSGYLIKHLSSYNQGMSNYEREDYRYQIQNGCSSPLIVNCEREILKAINWDFENYPNFYSIIDLYRSQGVLFSQDRVLNPHFQCYDLLSENTVLLVDKYVEFFSLLCLQDHTFLNINPYLICCAIIAASRKSAGILPIWPAELTQLSGLLINHFVNIQDQVLALYQNTFKKPLQSSEQNSQESHTNQIQSQVTTVQKQNCLNNNHSDNKSATYSKNNQSASTAESPLISPNKPPLVVTSQLKAAAFSEIQLQKITPDKIAFQSAGLRTSKAQQIRNKNSFTQVQSHAQLEQYSNQNCMSDNNNYIKFRQQNDQIQSQSQLKNTKKMQQTRPGSSNVYNMMSSSSNNYSNNQHGKENAGISTLAANTSRQSVMQAKYKEQRRTKSRPRSNIEFHTNTDNISATHNNNNGVTVNYNSNNYTNSQFNSQGGFNQQLKHSEYTSLRMQQR